MLAELIISPFWIVIVTIILWIILFQIFYRFLKLSEANWKRLEYIWLFIGLIGLVNVVVENRKTYNFYNSERVSNYIRSSIKNINSDLSSFKVCFKYNKTDFSPEDFDERQYDQDLICSWSKTYKIKLDTLGIPQRKLDTISKTSFNFKTNEMDDFITDFNEMIKTVNSEIKEYKTYREEYKTEEWKNFARTFGVLFIMIAFSIRLSIATKNVINSKTK